jgi:hypothetical protein
MKIDQIKDIKIKQYLEELKNDFPFNRSTYQYRLTNTETIVLGLCGKLKMYFKYYNSQNKVILYDDIEKYINKLILAKHLIKSDKQLLRKNKRKYINDKVRNFENWKKVYENNNKNIDVFLKLNTPLFLLQRHFKTNLIINPKLRDYNFQSKYSPYEMYQMIEQFLTNELAQSFDKPDNISDELKRDAHGFDKWTFKKHKHQRKGKKK